MHSKAKCFSLERSRGVEEARQEVKEHGQKTALYNGGEIFFEGAFLFTFYRVLTRYSCQNHSTEV